VVSGIFILSVTGWPPIQQAALSDMPTDMTPNEQALVDVITRSIRQANQRDFLAAIYIPPTRLSRQRQDQSFPSPSAGIHRLANRLACVLNKCHRRWSAVLTAFRALWK
jgi:hypothetical protein